MERITISSSLKFKELVRQAIFDLEKINIVGIFPNLDAGVKKEDVDLEFMKKLEAEHFDAIDSSDGLYVICPNGYVGTLVSVEIGYARAKGKPVIFSETPEDLGLQAMAINYVSLEEINKIKEIV
ncbi:MAG TPA: hypothetical protein VL401_01505 [Alphaproteobacteria bacterium]|jgi:nucleoside 2-deoxyribosyltransferase|nr:hypothetical protein [Alphaproteobacteria bacterium]